MSTGEKNKALVCRFLEAQSTGDLDALEELLAPDFVDHGLLPGQDPERDRVEHELQVARDIQLASLPEGVPTLEDWQIDPYCQPAREVGGYEVG